MEGDSYVLPADVKLIPVAEVSASVRGRIQGADDDFLVTRLGARMNSKAIDARFAGLLQEFREPRTIVAAVLEFSRKSRHDPERVLEDAFPLLRRFVAEKLLVPAGSQDRESIQPTLSRGQRVDDLEIGACLQVLEDTEIYRCRAAASAACALKIERPAAPRQIRESLQNEAAILEFLDGDPAPRLLKQGVWRERRYLVMEWMDGVPVTQAAAELRRGRAERLRPDLLRLCENVVRRFHRLHRRGVVHGDVHPKNVLVEAAGDVALLDFGVARRIDGKGAKPPRRAGVAFFFEPEYAKARRRGHRPPKATAKSDQYAVAALLYLMLTGRHYREFSLEKAEMLREIDEEGPAPLSLSDGQRWPELEAVIGKALAKSPDDRYPSLLEFADALARLCPTPDATAPPTAAADLAGAWSRRIFDRLGLEGLAGSGGLPPPPTASLDYGAAGVAYAHYRLAGIEEDPALLSLADVWACTANAQCGLEEAFYDEALGVTPTSVGRTSLHHSASGVHWVRALVSHAMGDFVSTRTALDLFVQVASKPCSNFDLTLGKAGLLQGCAQLLDAIPDHELLSLEPLRELGAELAAEIRERIDAAESCRDAAEVEFLGMAHGWAGLLYAALEWARVAAVPLPRRFQERLEQLAEMAEPVGRGVRWPIRCRSQADRHMPGWCNGAAGFVFLWTAAHACFGERRWGELAERAAWNAFEDPDRANNLCCGLVGRCYALLNVRKLTGDRAWLERARQLAELAVSIQPENGTGSDSLYKGDLGLALLNRELRRPESAAMPAFEPEGWPSAG